MNVIYELNDIVFEWDSDKADKVLKSHNVMMQEACSVFFDNSVAIVEDDRADYGEERCLAVGLSNQGRLLSVVWVQRKQNFRLITAFKATNWHKKLYTEQS